jgi:hypothetical protein
VLLVMFAFSSTVSCTSVGASATDMPKGSQELRPQSAERQSYSSEVL